MKTDTLFYRLFQSFPSLFFELIQHSPNEAENYQFASVEVKQLSFRIDGVFLPQGDDTEAPIYFTGCIPVRQDCPHPPAPSPKKGEGEPKSKSLSRSGRGI